MYGSLCLVWLFQHLVPWWFGLQTHFSVRRIIAQIETYLTVPEEKDVWAAHGDAAGMTLRRVGDSLLKDHVKVGVADYDGHSPQSWCFFSSHLCPFGGQGSLLARCGPMSLPRHLRAQMGV